jgi:Protein of unknown function (DUF1761)
MMLFSHINYAAVIVAAAAYFLVGSVWYGPLFAKKWAEQVGIKMGAGNSPVVPMVLQFVFSVIFTIGIALVIQIMNRSGLMTGIISALGVIVFFLLPINSSTWFFKNKPALFWIEFGYQSVGALIIGIILGLWK